MEKQNIHKPLVAKAKIHSNAMCLIHGKGNVVTDSSCSNSLITVCDVACASIDDFRNKIICGSAVDVMKKIPDGSIDLVITSPPYNLKNSTGNGMKDGRGGKWAN